MSVGDDGFDDFHGDPSVDEDTMRYQERSVKYIIPGRSRWQPVTLSELEVVIQSEQLSDADLAKFYNAYLALISAIDHDAVLSEPDWTRYVSDLGKIVGKPWDAYAEEPKSTKENPQIEIRANLKRWKTLLIKECLRVHDLSVFYKLGWRVALALCKCLDPDTDDLTLRMFGTLLLKDDFNVSSDYTNGIIKIARIGAHDEFDDWFASFYGDSFREFQRRQEDDRRERAKRQ